MRASIGSVLVSLSSLSLPPPSTPESQILHPGPSTRLIPLSPPTQKASDLCSVSWLLDQVASVLRSFYPDRSFLPSRLWSPCLLRPPGRNAFAALLVSQCLPNLLLYILSSVVRSSVITLSDCRHPHFFRQFHLVAAFSKLFGTTGSTCGLRLLRASLLHPR